MRLPRDSRRPKETRLVGQALIAVLLFYEMGLLL